MMKLTKVQFFIKRMVAEDAKQKVRRFPFPTDGHCKALIDFLISGQHPEYTDLLHQFQILNDDSDLFIGAHDQKETGRNVYENWVLACDKYIDDVSADIEDIEEQNKIDSADNISSFGQWKRSREL